MNCSTILPRRCLLAAAVLAACAGTASTAVAQAYPAKPIKIVAGYAPGTGVDTIARLLAQRLTEQLKISVVVENRDGAAGIVGAQSVARSAPDGYTVLLAPTTFAVSPHMQAQLPYDPVKDFVPVVRLAAGLPLAMVTSLDAPYKTFKEMVAYAKANPGKLTYATSGKGSPSHMETERLRKLLNIDVRDIPYKSSGQAITDTLSGQVSFYFPGATLSLPHVASGRARGLVMGSPKRSPNAPNLPTLAEELNMPGYDTGTWYGLFLPAGTPAAVVARLESETRKLLDMPEVQAEIAKTGAEAAPMDSAGFARFVRTESDKWGALVRELNLKQ